ncbi:DUF305 domain-containing protein [Tsukamurella serpentis]
MAAIAAGLIALAGCSAGDQSSAPGDGHAAHGTAEASSNGSAPSASPTSAVPGARFNDADVEFATMMYPHHAQAIEMADAIAGRNAGPEVVRLGEEIKRAQQPEMDAFTRLLAQWGRPAPSAKLAHTMEGMADTAQMEQLRSLRGPDFDRRWLTMMIAHHRGAITMAQTELARGIDVESRRIAEAVRTGQQAEIERMQALLPPS